MFLSLMCKVEREKKKKNSGKLKTQKCKRRYFFLAEGKGLGSTSFWVEERMCTPCSQKKKCIGRGLAQLVKKNSRKGRGRLNLCLRVYFRKKLYFSTSLSSSPFSLLVFAPRKKERRAGSRKDSYLVDPASSHMLVSKIKPCMSKYKQPYTVKLRMAH